METKTTPANVSRNEVIRAKRAASKGLLQAVSTLSNRCKLVYQFRDSEGVQDYIKALGLTAQDVKNANPSELVKFWKCQTSEGVAIAAKTFYKKVDENGVAVVDSDGRKVIDYQIFESKDKWTFKNVLDLLDYSRMSNDKRPKVRVYEVGVKYDIVKGDYVKRVEQQ